MIFSNDKRSSKATICATIICFRHGYTLSYFNGISDVSSYFIYITRPINLFLIKHLRCLIQFFFSLDRNCFVKVASLLELDISCYVFVIKYEHHFSSVFLMRVQPYHPFSQNNYFLWGQFIIYTCALY